MLSMVTAADRHNNQAKQDALPILLYHQVVNNDSGASAMVISAATFDRQMKHLVDNGFTALSMEEVIQFMEGRVFPGKVVAIHFDDSWRSQRLAIKILEKYKLKASFFVIVSEISAGSAHLAWSDLKGLIKNPLFGVYSHTLNHPWKKGATLEDMVSDEASMEKTALAWRELVKSRTALENELGVTIPYLAWPADIYNNRLIELARKAGYQALLTANAGLNRPGGDIYRIFRTPVDGRCTLESVSEILETGRSPDCSGRKVL